MGLSLTRIGMRAEPNLACACRMLESKLVEAKSKKDTLKARAKTAQTSRQIADMVQVGPTTTVRSWYGTWLQLPTA